MRVGKVFPADATPCNKRRMRDYVCLGNQYFKTAKGRGLKNVSRDEFEITKRPRTDLQLSSNFILKTNGKPLKDIIRIPFYKDHRMQQRERTGKKTRKDWEIAW